MVTLEHEECGGLSRNVGDSQGMWGTLEYEECGGLSKNVGDSRIRRMWGLSKNVGTLEYEECGGLSNTKNVGDSRIPDIPVGGRVKMYFVGIKSKRRNPRKY